VDVYATSIKMKSTGADDRNWVHRSVNTRCVFTVCS